MIKASNTASKKGQVTIFIILGIVIIVILAFFVYLGIKIQNSPLERYNPNLADEIKDKVTSCLESFAEDGLIKIGAQGGYIALPLRFLRTDYSDIGYSYWEGQIVLRELREIENELAKYIDANLAECVDFTSFNKVKITAKNPLTKVNLGTEKITVATQYPLLIQYSTGEAFTTKDPFVLGYNIRFGYLHSELKAILEKKVSDSEVEPFLDLEGKDYKLTFFEYDQGTKQVYVFFDPWSELRGKKYKLVSALAL